MRIAVDLDNVTLDWQGHWVDVYEHWFDREVPHEAECEWSGFLTGTHFENAAGFWAWMDLAKVWKTMPYVPGAQGALWQLKADGHHILFCTARPVGQATAEAERLALWDWHSPIDFKAANEKHSSKADLWIDDSPEVLDSLIKHGKTCIRFAQPWNKEAPSTYVAHDWHEVLEIVGGL